MMCAWVVLSLLRRACGEHTDLAHRPERRVSVVHGKGCEGFLMLVRCSDLHICTTLRTTLFLFNSSVFSKYFSSLLPRTFNILTWIFISHQNKFNLHLKFKREEKKKAASNPKIRICF